MIKLIVGQKGSGKTKAMIEMANDAVNKVAGDIVFVDGSNRQMVDLSFKVRAINIKDFGITGVKDLYGFLCGILAGNYDINQIYLDGLFDILNFSGEDIEAFIFYIKKLSEKFNISFIISMNGNPETVPAYLKEYIA